MGKKIDRFVLASIFAAILFFYFEAAFQNSVVAILLSLFSCIIIRKILRRLLRWFGNTHWQQKRILKRKSGSALMHLACMDEADAYACICRLVENGYGYDEPLSLELIHPSMQLSQEKVFNAWRAHRGSDKLVVCTTGKCSTEARIFASSLKSPRIAIVDADMLCQLIAEHPEVCSPIQSTAKKRTLRLQHIAQLIFNRQNAPRGILFSFAMLVMYVFSGSVHYLAASLFLLFIALVSLRRNTRPVKLF